MCKVSARIILAITLLVSALVHAQTPPPPATAQPMAAPDAAQFTQVLAQIDQTSQQTNLDLAQLRIEKWKTGSDHKQQAQSDAESLMKNLSAALPGMVSTARATPNALAPALKLYRDLNALYDVLTGLTESVGAFGPKDDYNALSNDQRALDAGRRGVGDYLDSLAAYRDAQIVKLTQQVAANNAQPAKKIIVDDEAPPPPKHKKAKAKPAATNTAAKPSSTTAPAQAPPQKPQ
jgi:hypothetical protein